MSGLFTVFITFSGNLIDHAYSLHSGKSVIHEHFYEERK